MCTKCAICLLEISISCDTHTLACAHVFHRECVSNWLCKHDSCPLCRAKAMYPLSLNAMTNLVKMYRWDVQSHVFVRLCSILGVGDTMRLFSEKMFAMYIVCDLSFDQNITLEEMRSEYEAISDLLGVTDL